MSVAGDVMITQNMNTTNTEGGSGFMNASECLFVCMLLGERGYFLRLARMMARIMARMTTKRSAPIAM